MPVNKPSIPQGTRDFSAEVIYKRQYIINTIKTVFENYGFEPLETPAFENLTTLMGKYGDEGDKLMFKILNNGLADKAEKAKLAFEDVLHGKSSPAITERALKYDLTIPFARYVAMNYAHLNLPYKRYQIQPVWRADRPQKGRYREFVQCDADIVGSENILNEIDLLNIYADVFKALQLKVNIRINSRKILVALAQICGGDNHLVAITTAIDKLDKIGLDKVLEELQTKEITEAQQIIIKSYLEIEGDSDAKIKALSNLFETNEIGKQGIEEITQILLITNLQNNFANIVVEPTLARGLNYYTGIIIEVQAADFAMGSIGGGGRYNNLTELFGVPNVPGVGISFGLDRIYDVLEGLDLFNTTQKDAVVKIMFLNHSNEQAKACYPLLQSLRQVNFIAEIYYNQAKIDKQYKYAESKGITHVINALMEKGEDNCTVKNINTGLQEKVAYNALISYNFM